MPQNPWRGTVIWLIAVSLFSVNAPLSLCAPPGRVINKVRTILEMERADAAAAHSVEVDVRVYYFDPEWRFFFVEQDGDFICVHAGEDVVPIGTRIRLVGKTGAGNRKNVIDFESMTVLEAGKIDDPTPVTFDESCERFDCNWVTGECVVETARIESHRTVLVCRNESYKFCVAFPVAMTAEEVLPLINSRIRVTGNLGSDFDEDVYVGTEICAPQGSFEIVELAKRPVEFVERRSVDDWWNDEDVESFHLVGQVTFVDRAGLFIETETSGTWIHNDRGLPFQQGMYVAIHGTRNRDRKLYARLTRNLGGTELSRPKFYEIGRLKTLRPESRRVRVEGSLVQVRHGGRGAVLSMVGDGGEPFCVYLSVSEEQLLSMDLETAVRLSVTGTVSFYVEDHLEFAIYSPSQNEVLVKERTAVMSRRNVIGMLAVLGPLLGFVVLWGQSHRRQSRARQRDLEHLTAALQLSFESIRDGVLILDSESNVVHANQKVCDFTGLHISTGDLASQIESGLQERLVVKDFIEDWRRLNLDDARVEEFSLELNLSGERRSLEVFTAPIENDLGLGLARLWTFHDVTEKQLLQASLLHAQKQEAIGRLAGGFAHDFNNLLTGVIGSLSVASLDERKTVGEISDHLKTAEGASERAATLVSQLLGFSRKTRLDLKQNDVNLIINRMEPLLRPVSKSVRVSFQLQDDIPTVRVDATQLEQVLLNICLNACDALGEDYGEIFVRSYARHVTRQGKEGLFVIISIRDTGPGIDDKTREKMFEPFFTTKQGKGTGLGLAMAEGIVHQHGGWLECDTAIGVGTEFRVYLPACTQRVSVPVEPVEKPLGDLANRVILVVDDEDVVRRAMSAMLRQHGATAHTAPDGIQAVSLLQKHDVDLVLLDWTMPVISGKETLQRIKKHQPTIPVVVCSGFAFDVGEITRKASVAPDEVMQKPFNSEKIRRVVLEVLEKTSSVGKGISPQQSKSG